jgi:Zn-dependent protease with chaperone function
LVVDFFDRQEASHRATRKLVLLFGLAFLAVALATAIVVLIALGLSGSDPGVLLGEPQLLIGAVAVVVAMMVLASLYRVAVLSQGGGHVARMLGGTEIQGDDPDPLHRRLRNVVEEMAIASGVPVPEIYVLEQEAGINAFAAGLTPADAAVAVTRGSLERLNRAELQGVIAHEFSHILNGDMRLNLRLMGFSFGILVLSLLGRSVLRASGRGLGMRINRRGKGGSVMIIALALLLIGGIGVILSRLIKAAVSRQREVLADASAVQFTREPLALADALKKIGGFTPYINTVETEEVSHMLFGRAGKSFTGLFATHPPLPERIRALDPSFKDGEYIASDPVPAAESGAAAAFYTAAPGTAAASGAAAKSGAAATSGDNAAPFKGPGGQMAEIRVESAGTIAPSAGRHLRQAIPADVVDAAHSSQSAWLLVLALGLERGGGSALQRRLVENQIGADRAARCFDLNRQFETLPPGLRLPLIELAVPALKARPPEQIRFLFDLLAKLADADGHLSLPEYLLRTMLHSHFFPPASIRASAGERQSAMKTLIAVIAIEGHDDPASAEAAFLAGIGTLGESASTDANELKTRKRPADSYDDLDTALRVLAGASAPERRRALQALAVAMRNDTQTTVAEAELFRVVAATLGCPVPPTGLIG